MNGCEEYLLLLPLLSPLLCPSQHSSRHISRLRSSLTTITTIYRSFGYTLGTDIAKFELTQNEFGIYMHLCDSDYEASLIELLA